MHVCLSLSLVYASWSTDLASYMRRSELILIQALELTQIMGVHLNHDSALGCLKVHLDDQSIGFCRKVHLDCGCVRINSLGF